MCLPLLFVRGFMSKRLIVLTVNLFILASDPAVAVDWGYDEPHKQTPPAEVEPMRAVAQPFSKAGSATKPGAGNPASASGRSAKPAAPKVGAGAKSAAPAAGSTTVKSANLGAPPTVPIRKSSVPSGKGHPASQSLVQECWSQVYEIGSGNKLTDDQRSRLNDIVNRKLAAGGTSAAEANAVLSFWPKVGDYLVAHPDQKENYGLLLHALLRWRARNQNAYLSQNKSDELMSDESAFISEILGPTRLSVGGTVPFSEDALNAYTDMACFVYEQQHPGKSVDAADNRDLFGMIVAKKFKEAPTQKDQEAMTGFDLAWAKFKIAWTAADPAHRAVLLNKLVTSGAGVAWAEGRDAVLDSVLTNWPGSKPTAPASASSAAPRR